MIGLWLAVAFVLWYSTSLYISETFASKWLGKQMLFFITFIISPIIGLLFVFLSKRIKK